MKRFALTVLAICAVLALFVPTSSASVQTAPTSGPRQATSGPAVFGEYLVKFKPSAARQARESALSAQGGKVIDRVAHLDVEVAEFPALKASKNTRAAQIIVNTLKRNPNVEYIEPNYIYSVNFTPNDPGRTSQYAWNNIQAYTAWDVTQGSASTVIAVVDTGIQRTHPDLDSKIVAGYDYVQNDTAPDDGNGHGTHVAGTSAAETNNSTAGAGTCPNCKLMPVRVLDDAGSGTLANVANGINFAADNGAKVINLSLGGSGSATLENAVNYAWGKGVFLACAAGNSNTSSQTNSYPAAYTNCYAIASTDSADARSSFSNYGNWVEVAAPGSNIYSTWLNSGTNTISGTSMATPHVAGLAGLLASQGLTNAQIRDRINGTADQISGTGTYWVYGRINAYRAVTGSGGTPTPTPITPTPTPPSGAEKIVNGGFESGSSPWVQTSSGGYQMIDTTLPHAGAYSAYLADYNNGTDSIYQTVTIPANGSLRYWWYMSTQESGTTAYDYLRVRLYNSSGTLVATLRTWSNASGAGTWRQDTISLASYAGQNLRVQFTGTNDSTLPTGFFVDDVSVR